MGSCLVYGEDEARKQKFVQGVMKSLRPQFIHSFGSEKPVGIEDVREIQRMASLSPGDGVQLFLLYNGDRMTREAVNALLKILEEPPAASLFCVVSTTLEGLPQTFLSRLEKYYISGENTRAIERGSSGLLSIERAKEKEEVRIFLEERIREFKDELESGIQSKEALRRLQKYMFLTNLLAESRVSARVVADLYMTTL